MRAFFRGVGPRALSNGINSAVFFCFFEAFRRALVQRQQEAAARKQAEAAAAPSPVPLLVQQKRDRQQQQKQQHAQLQAELAEQHVGAGRQRRSGRRQQDEQQLEQNATGSGRLACLSLALPVGASPARWW